MEGLVARGTRLLDKFNPKRIDFLKWLSCFEYIIECLEITEDLEAEFLLHMVEPLVYDNLALLLSPSDVHRFSYKQIILVMEQIYSPFQGESAAEYRFKTRVQMIGESVPHYAIALTLLINNCRREFFTTANLLNQFIHGLINPVARHQLLRQPNLIFRSAVMIAQEMDVFYS